MTIIIDKPGGTSGAGGTTENLVPYVGATSDVDLGTQTLDVGTSVTINSPNANGVKKIVYASENTANWQFGHVNGANEDFQIWDGVAGAVVTLEMASAATNSIYVKQGYVGLGTSDPLAKLHVQGGVFVTGGLTSNSVSIGTDLNMGGDIIIKAGQKLVLDGV